MDGFRENYILQQERNKLILHISHDLKNPLAAILGYSEILTGENNLTEEEKKVEKYYPHNLFMFIKAASVWPFVRHGEKINAGRKGGLVR